MLATEAKVTDQVIDKDTGQVHGKTSFSHVLFQMDAGKFHDVVSEKLTLLLVKMRAHLDEQGEKVARGSLTVSLDIRVDAMGFVEITPSSKTVEPKPKDSRRIMFLDHMGRLTPRNPNQPDLPFQTVGGSAAKPQIVTDQ